MPVGLRRLRLRPVTVLVMQAEVSFWDSLLFDGIDDLVVEAVTADFGTVDVVARGWAAGAVCPDCGGFSNRVHDSAVKAAVDRGGATAVHRLTGTWPVLR
ncbi:hypothetical protein OG729_00880 [Streptomyces sp. NBC_00210]|uniref:hypothetical protein n=2 Tax=unclassified Streptomyces TaxID=2593676 RepID=UPI00324A3ACD